MEGIPLSTASASGSLGRPLGLTLFALTVGSQLRVDRESGHGGLGLSSGRADDVHSARSLSIATEVAVRLGQCPKPLHGTKVSRQPDVTLASSTGGSDRPGATGRPEPPDAADSTILYEPVWEHCALRARTASGAPRKRDGNRSAATVRDRVRPPRAARRKREGDFSVLGQKRIWSKAGALRFRRVSDTGEPDQAEACVARQ